MRTTNQTQEPMRPDTSAFREHPMLFDLFHCWMDARGHQMLPIKNVFEIASLDHPKLLPELTLIEFISSTEFRYRYMGSVRVQRRGEDQTRKNIKRAFAPNARQFIADWTRATFEQPHMSVWRDQTRLPNGEIAQGIALCVVLTDDAGQPNYMAVVSDENDDFDRRWPLGGYLVGSEGLQVLPIDIGLGTPDLPRVLD